MIHRSQARKFIFSREWLAGTGLLMLLAACSTPKHFNRGPYLAYGLGQNTAFVPVEPYVATENVRNALICNNPSKVAFVHRDLQEDRFVISNAALAGSNKSYEIIVAWSFTGTLLHVVSSEPVPEVINAVSNFAKQGATCSAVKVK